MVSDGDLLVAGVGTRISYSEGVIVRLNRRGRLVTGFGNGGIIRYSEDSRYSMSSFSAVTARPRCRPHRLHRRDRGWDLLTQVLSVIAVD